MLRLLITRNQFRKASWPVSRKQGESAVRRLMQDLGKAARGGSALRADIVRAVAELAFARIHHAITPVRDLPLRPPPGQPAGQPAAFPAGLPETGPANLSAAQQALLQRVTYVVPRIGRRLPWRSDCLVQALAARRWLASKGIAGVIRLGSRIGADGKFEAHAWFTVGEAVVTGWDIERFAEFAAFPLDRPRPDT